MLTSRDPNEIYKNPLGRMMVFVDGENLIFRFQSMLEKGWVARDDIAHIQDVLVWSNWCGGVTNFFRVLKATYYTYAVGDEKTIDSIRGEIRKLEFPASGFPRLPNNLTPCVFKKPKRQASAKGVDIQLTVDVLSHVHSNNVDAILLLAGDGDYEPLVREVTRSGKLVYLAAFSDGLSPKLPQIVDNFYCLDNHMFPAGAPS